MTENTNPSSSGGLLPREGILSTPVEFQEDVLKRLGRANGNIYHRKPGVESLHDGQIMVRLKKKRFIVLEYGVDPDELQGYDVPVPAGAGRQKCSNPDCTKIGVPILLFDSSPEEPASLYLRSGLCFTCQRSLNEKRRTQRKRKTNPHDEAGSLKNVSARAVIIDAPPQNCKFHGADYGIYEIAVDVDSELKESFKHVQLLIQSLSTATSCKSVSNEAVAVAASIAESQGLIVKNEDIEAAAAAAVSSTLEEVPRKPNVMSHYQDAMNSMKKCVFLLKEFEASWNSNQFQHQQQQPQQPPNMIPLLLAADAREDNPTNDTKSITNNFEVVNEEEMDGIRIATV